MVTSHKTQRYDSVNQLPVPESNAYLSYCRQYVLFIASLKGIRMYGLFKDYKRLMQGFNKSVQSVQ